MLLEDGEHLLQHLVERHSPPSTLERPSSGFCSRRTYCANSVDIAAYSSTKEVLLIPQNPSAWCVLRERSDASVLRLLSSLSGLLPSVALADYTSPMGRQQGSRHLEVLMHLTQ